MRSFRKYKTAARLLAARRSARQIVQELRRQIDAGHQQMIAGAGARHVKQVPFAVVDFFEVGIVGDILVALPPAMGGSLRRKP